MQHINPSNIKPTKVWDGPVRAFHWSLVILIVVSWITGKLGGDWLAWHFRSGYAVLALVLFRILWGFLGTSTARFSYFLKGPKAMAAHALHLWRRGPDHDRGHNPLGGWMVILLLLMILLQAVTGLFADDDIATTGPLTSLIATALSAKLTTLHRFGADALTILVGLHVLAVVIYLIVFRHNLIKPMITGLKDFPADLPSDTGVEPGANANMPLAVFLVIFMAATVYALVVWLPILATR